jgi:hypothetical protein
MKAPPVLNSWRKSALSAALCFAVAACGGGSEDSEEPTSGTPPKPAPAPVPVPAPPPPTVSAMPVFLLAGQSNMVGSVPKKLLEDFVTELASKAPNLEKRLDDLLWAYYVPTEEYSQRSDSNYQRIKNLEIAELIRLHREGWVGAQATPECDVFVQRQRKQSRSTAGQLR